MKTSLHPACLAAGRGLPDVTARHARSTKIVARYLIRILSLAHRLVAKYLGTLKVYEAGALLNGSLCTQLQYRVGVCKKTVSLASFCSAVCALRHICASRQEAVFLGPAIWSEDWVDYHVIVATAPACAGRCHRHESVKVVVILHAQVADPALSQKRIIQLIVTLRHFCQLTG